MLWTQEKGRAPSLLGGVRLSPARPIINTFWFFLPVDFWNEVWPFHNRVLGKLKSLFFNRLPKTGEVWEQVPADMSSSSWQGNGVGTPGSNDFSTFDFLELGRIESTV